MTTIETIRYFWDARPCNLRHSTAPVGSRQYFDEVEQRKYFVEPHIPGFADFFQHKDSKVLEVGCGIGTDTMNFARYGCKVTAVDLSDESLKLSIQRSQVYSLQDWITFYQLNAEELSKYVPVEPYDLIYSFGVIHHTPNPEAVLKEMRKYCHKGTTIKIMLYAKWSIKNLTMQQPEAQAGCPIATVWTKEEVKDLLNEAGFKVTEIRKTHIFPWKISDYIQHRYVKCWYYRWMPNVLFHILERFLGWHLLITAEPI